MNPITQDRLTDAFRDRLGGFVRDALDDPDVIEVMVNACGRVWLDRLQQGRHETDQSLPPSAAEAIIRLVAHHIGETVSDERPLVAGTLPLTGERFQGVLPPVAKAPSFTIRKRPKALLRLDDYLEAGAMSDEQGSHPARCLGRASQHSGERRHVVRQDDAAQRPAHRTGDRRRQDHPDRGYGRAAMRGP